jgi:stress-induced morphogen
MTLSADKIKDLIKKKLPDAQIELEDIRGDNNHYHAKIRSSQFKGLSKIKQHQMIYNAIGSHMGTTLHALMLTTSEL